MEKRRLRGLDLILFTLIILGGLSLFHLFTQILLVFRGVKGFADIFSPLSNFHNSYMLLSYEYRLPTVITFLFFLCHYINVLFVPLGYFISAILLLNKKLMRTGRKIILNLAIIHTAIKIMILCTLLVKDNTAYPPPFNLFDFFIRPHPSLFLWRITFFSFTLIVGIFIICYLTHPKVKEQFN